MSSLTPEKESALGSVSDVVNSATTRVTSSFTSSGPSDTPLADEMARISRDEFDRYLREFRPTEQDTIASLNDSTVGVSMDAAQGDAVRARASLDRMRERYGVSLDPTQAAGEVRQSQLSGALGTLTAGNTAADFDRDNKRQTLAGLVNVGQELRNQAMGGMGSAAGMEGTRASNDSANKIAKKQQNAANRNAAIGATATIATAAIMF